MKTIHSTVSALLLATAFCLITFTASSQEKGNAPVSQKQAHEQARPDVPSPQSPPCPPRAPGNEDNEGMNDNPQPLNIPGLTDDQKVQIRELRLRQMESVIPLRNQIREKRARLATILTTQPVDMVAAETIADDLGKLNASLLKLMIRHDQALRNILTKDQQVIFDSRPKPFLKGRGRVE
jgi:Spy/CpxP family protein refolding chaperone